MTRKRGLPPPSRMGKGIKSKRKNAKSSVNKIRDLMYATNKSLGDLQAINSGKVLDRANRRFTGNIGARILGSDLFKFLK